MSFVFRSFLLLAAVVSCRADVVFLTNADRISGEIQKMDERVLSVKTGYAGIVQIDWSKVQKVSSGDSFDVQTESGLKFLGPIEESIEGLVVVTKGGRVLLEPSSVVSIRPASEEGTGETFWSRFSGNLDLGYSFARGNSDLTQSALTANSTYTAGRNQIKANLSSLFNRQVDAPTTSRHAVGLRFDRFINPGSFLFALSSLERDDRRRLNLRSRLGGGFGWKLIRSQRTQLSVLSGFTYVNEQFNRPPDGGPAPQNTTGEGLAGLDVETTTFSRVKLFSKLNFYPNVINRGRYRATWDSGIRMPLIGRLTWNLTLFDHFDSKPPLDVSRNDYGLASTVGINF